MSLVIRRASPMDLDALHRIELECFTFESFSKQQIAATLKLPSFVNLIAMLDGEPVGFIMGATEMHKRENVGHIYSVDVKPAYRQRGIGSSLLEALEHIFIGQGVETCYLEVRIDNVAAKSLYSKHGYKLSETVKNYYGLGINGVRLKKDLKPNP